MSHLSGSKIQPRIHPASPTFCTTTHVIDETRVDHNLSGVSVSQFGLGRDGATPTALPAFCQNTITAEKIPVLGDQRSRT